MTRTEDRTAAVLEYHEQGFTGPFRVYSRARAAAGWAAFFDAIGQSGDDPRPTDRELTGFCHRYRWAYELATEPAILDRVEAVLGPDVVLWAMPFWYKPPRTGRAVPWHQDATYWPMEPRINCSAWVTLGEATPENGCLRLVRGSHKQWLDDRYRSLGEGTTVYDRGLPEAEVEPERVVELAMQPGEAVLFTEATIHSSGPNLSDAPRVAFVLRFTTPEVRFDVDQIQRHSSHVRTMLVRGEDRFHHNPTLAAVPPAAASPSRRS